MKSDNDDRMGKILRIAQLSTIFTPRAPVAQKDRFQGRIDQIIDVTTAITSPGSHVVLYGERGVGKTSLANVLSEFLTPLWAADRLVRINCSTQDSFRSLWRKVFQALEYPMPEDWSFRTPDPDEIRGLLEKLDPPAVIIIDEYDRMEDDDGLSLMADTVKAFSDHAVRTKLVIVGVADSIDGLVGEHASVQRAFVEVEMPRMSQDELVSILDRGLAMAHMTISTGARQRISRLAEGLPHYVHLLALSAAQTALKDDRNKVRVSDVEVAISGAVQTHSLVKEYQHAIQSPRRENLFAKVLLACALADKNRLGYFTASAVRDPMSRIMQKQYAIPAFSRHLRDFL